MRRVLVAVGMVLVLGAGSLRVVTGGESRWG